MAGQNGCSFYKLWIKLQRFSRAPGKTKFYIGLFIVVNIIVSLSGMLVCNSCFILTFLAFLSLIHFQSLDFAVFAERELGWGIGVGRGGGGGYCHIKVLDTYQLYTCNEGYSMKNYREV